MYIEHTLEDVEGDIISFQTFTEDDTMEIMIPFNEETMPSGIAVVSLTKQDIARLAVKLDLPEVTNE